MHSKNETISAKHYYNCSLGYFILLSALAVVHMNLQTYLNILFLQDSLKPR